MRLETDRGQFFVDNVRRMDITQAEFDRLVREEDARRHGQAFGIVVKSNHQGELP